MRDSQVVISRSVRDTVLLRQRHPATEFRLNSWMGNSPKETEQLKDRALSRMAELGLNQAEVVARSKIPTSTLNGILGSGNAQKSVGHENLYRLAKVLQTSMEYLAMGGGKGPPVDNLEFLLSAEELALLRAYRAGNTRERSKIDGFIASMAISPRPPRKTTKERRSGKAANETTTS